MLLCALRAALRDEGAFRGRPEPNLGSYLDLVALGTVADVAPLTGANRALVRAGLAVLRRGERAGLRALMERASVAPGSADESDLSFRLAPRLNAAGRMGDPALATRLLLTGDPSEASSLAAHLDEMNQGRRREEERVLSEAEGGLGDEARRGSVIVAWGEGWHPGVLGIVASRLSEKYGRPAVVLRVDGDEAAGSARGVEGFHLVEALSAVGHLLDRFGGHRQAAGLALRRDRLEAFREGLLRTSAPLLPGAPPPVTADSEVSLAEVGEPLLAEWERLRPFGAGNAEPLLSARDVTVLRRSPLGGTGLHWRLLVDGGGAVREVTAFHRPDGVAGEGETVDLLFTPVTEAWKGGRAVRLALRGSRRSSAAAAP
jgi:single-stranded-DNA-specific exonuclease